MSVKNQELEREHSFILQKHFKSLVSGDQKQQWEERNRQIDRQLRMIWRESLKTNQSTPDHDDDVSDREKSIILSRMWMEAIEQGRENSWLNFINQQNTDGQSACESLFGCCQTRCASVIKPCTWLDHFDTQTNDEEFNWLSNVIEQAGRMNSAPALPIAHLQNIQKRQIENQDIAKTSTQPHLLHTSLQEEVKYTGAKEYSTAHTSPMGPSSICTTPSEKILMSNNCVSPHPDLESAESKLLQLITQELNEISLRTQEVQQKSSNDNVEQWLSHQNSSTSDVDMHANVCRSEFSDQNDQQNSAGMSSRVQENSLPLKTKNAADVEQNIGEDVAKLPKRFLCCTIM